MKRILNTAATSMLVLLLVTAGAAPAPAASYKYGRENTCAGGAGRGLGCNPGIVVKHWHKAGAKARGVGWVYASTNETAGKRRYHARWLYQRPGGKLTAATGWKRAKRPSADATFLDTQWGKDGRTGPQYPANTKICVQIKETNKKACVRLR
ncbi:hypothetical protein [Streptomyces roseolus]|uniref:hypothetical protein n=1 Tax=Streptomyces roseolus TaxID=67358 RepID=UPI0016724E70|nr:hypothetical protein [Streptomyces roseolus]